jgi:hypothetical protein
MNLFLAAVWLTLGIGILMLPDNAPLIDAEKRPWAGGAALMLAGYNVVRWWLLRSQQKAIEELRRMQQRERLRERPTRHDEPPNPDFDFSEPQPRDPAPPSGSA